MRHIDDVLRYQRDFGARHKSVYLLALVRLGKVYGAYVSLLYIVMKLLYLVNVIIQFVLLNSFLETSDYPLFGGHVLWDLLLVMIVGIHGAIFIQVQLLCFMQSSVP